MLNKTFPAHGGHESPLILLPATLLETTVLRDGRIQEKTRGNEGSNIPVKSLPLSKKLSIVEQLL